MRERIKKTLADLIEQDGEAAYQDALRAIRQLIRWPPQAQSEVYGKWVTDARKREARYRNREPLRKAVRKQFPGVEEWIKEPPRKRGQPRPQRERDGRNVRLLAAIRYTNRLLHFHAGRWPKSMVVEIVACHYGFSGAEVERALHRGAKEIERALRHLR
jgi:hypothetical protein